MISTMTTYLISKILHNNILAKKGLTRIKHFKTTYDLAIIRSQSGDPPSNETALHKMIAAAEKLVLCRINYTKKITIGFQSLMHYLFEKLRL